MSNDKILLISENNSPIEINILTDTMGERKMDIRNLRNYGYCTFDPGFNSTAACESQITYINGEKGILLYRGFPVEQLALTASYLEVCYLLLNGEAPTKKQYDKFCGTLDKYRNINRQILKVYQGYSKCSHPMSILCGVMVALAADYHNVLNDVDAEKNKDIAIFKLIAIMPIIAAMCYRYLSNKNFIYPKYNLSYSSNLLYMILAVPKIDYVINPIVEQAMNRILIVHADHEQNISTSIVRAVGSSGSNLFACIVAGITALWGRSHGGANEGCLHMLEEINSVERIPTYIKRAKDKNDTFRLMGFGHRIYKNYDPRALLMRQTCYEVLKELNVSDNLLEIAVELEHIALHDPYFIERKLYPNVDFYSGIILKAIGIPSNMFTVIFAVARTIGWAAHWREMHNIGFRITRPRQLYSGPVRREFHSKIK